VTNLQIFTQKKLPKSPKELRTSIKFEDIGKIIQTFDNQILEWLKRRKNLSQREAGSITASFPKADTSIIKIVIMTI